MNIAIIDDETNRKNNGISACKKLNLNCIKSDEINSEETFNEWVHWCNNHAPEDLIIILDLGLQKRTSNDIYAPFQSAIKIIEKYDGNDFSVFMDECTTDGLAAAVAAIESVRIKRLLIIIASGRGHIAEAKIFLTELVNMKNREGVCKVEFSLDNITLDSTYCPDMILNAVKLWKKYFPEFHDDKTVNDIVSEWLDYYCRINATIKANPPERNFCGHDHIENNKIDYGNVLKRGLDLTDENIYNINSLKSVFMLVNTFNDNNWPDSAFMPWPPDQPTYSAEKKVLPLFLKSVLQSISGLSVEINSDGRNINLPITPGLPFLLALRNLFTTLRKEELLSDSEKLKIVSYEKGTQLEIPLNKAFSKFGLASTWLKKIKEGDVVLCNGVCGSLFKVLKANVDLSDATVQDDDQRKLLKIFQGLNRPIVGVHFAPHYIHLYWN